MKASLTTMPIERLKVYPHNVAAAAIYPFCESLLAMGARESKYDDPYNMFSVVGVGKAQRILVPRNMAPEDAYTEFSEGLDVQFNCTFEARNSEQTRIVKESTERLLNGENFLTQCPTGFGKTACAMPVIANVGKKTLVIVTKEDLRDQWVDSAKKFLGLTMKEIGLVQGATFQIQGKSFVVAMVQSIAKEDRYPIHLFKEFGLVIWDECHRVAADYFSQSGFRIPSKLRWGLSATPDRKDGKIEVVYAHIGEVKVVTHDAPMPFRVVARRSPWKIPMTRIVDPKSGVSSIGPIPHSPSKSGHVVNMLCKHQARNQMLVDFTVAAVKSGRIGLVQSDRREHLENLSMMLQKAGISPGDMGYYVGGMNKTQIEETKTKKVMFACVSEDTECLTLEGWKTHSQLEVGELIATYNLESKVIEYQPLGGVHTYPYSGELCHVNRKTADILMTWNHRNIIESKGVQRVVRADELRRTYKVRAFAPVKYPVGPSIGVELAALMGWVIAEGSYSDGKRGKGGVKIYQNRGPKADRIRNLLNGLGFSFSERAYDSNLTQIMFRLSSAFGTLVRLYSPDKRLNKQLVSLPILEAQALFDALIDGDGHSRRDGRLSFIQKDKVTVDWFCILAMRLGYKPTIGETYDANGNHTYRVYLGHADLVGLSNGSEVVSSKPYVGVVWCPTTPNTTWVARRNGTVFITGNTYQMTSEGTDIPWLDFLVMGTPKSDVRQIIGRIRRFMEGKKMPLVFDIIDLESNVFSGYWNSRRRWYHLEQVEVRMQPIVSS